MSFRQDSRRYLLDDDEPGHSKQAPASSFDQHAMASYQSHGNPPPPQFPMPSPQLDQPAYAYPFADATHSTSDFPVADAAPPPKASKWRVFTEGSKEMIVKRWPRYFFLVAVCQGLLCITFESYTFGKFQGNTDWDWAERNPNKEVQANLKTIPTFLSLFMLGFLYEVVLAWDALIAKNTIQIIGLVISNLALLIYTSIQISDIGKAVGVLIDNNVIVGDTTWNQVHPFLVAIPCILAVGTILFAFVAWKLYQEFAWDILKYIGADYRMKKRYLHYQIYIALLKFDLFFFIGFTVQFLVVVGGSTSIETALTAAAIPVTMCILLAAGWFTRKEFKPGVYGIVVLYLGALAYFIFKLARIYDPGQNGKYAPVAKSLSAFASLTIILIICTIVNALVCLFNFGHGLKPHLNTVRPEMDKDQVSYSLNDVKQPTAPSRMTID